MKYLPIPELTDADLERFWAKVNKDGDCWLWTAYRDKNGYGGFVINDSKYLAHRISYTIANGDPGEINVNHLYDNPPCVNPAHLWTGTQREGIDDKVTKNRQAQGETQGQHILTEKQAKEILASDESHCVLAERYGVHRTTIASLKRGRSWKYLRGERWNGLRINNTTGVKGVSSYRNKYRAEFQLNKKKYWLGQFDTIEGAAQAIVQKKLELSCETG